MNFRLFIILNSKITHKSHLNSADRVSQRQRYRPDRCQQAVRDQNCAPQLQLDEERNCVGEKCRGRGEEDGKRETANVTGAGQREGDQSEKIRFEKFQHRRLQG